MLEGLAARLGAVFQRLASRGRLTESDVNDVAREVRIALLEADVNLAVAKDFVAKIKEKAVGAEVLASLTPGQSVVKIVYDELVALMGGAAARLQFSDAPPSVILLVGLQGSGKTTHAGKLGVRLKEQGRRSLLVAADVYRPAAIEQLQTLGTQIGLPVFADDSRDPVGIARRGLEEARRLGLSTVIIDTAGRLQIDDDLMRELERIKEVTNPKEVLLVVDAMTGQEAVAVAKGFNARLGVTGVILTKMDGDTRGGAALSILQVTGAPIKFVGVGEKINALEQFYPDRLASRILGMGDVLTLIEKTQAVYSVEQARELEAKRSPQRVHAGRLPGPVAPSAQDGLDGRDREDDPGTLEGPAEGRRDRRARYAAHLSDHLLDDGSRTPATGDSQRFAPPPHRAGQRNASRRSQSAGQTIRRRTSHDEAVGQR